MKKQISQMFKILSFFVLAAVFSSCEKDPNPAIPVPGPGEIHDVSTDTPKDEPRDLDFE